MKTFVAFVGGFFLLLAAAGVVMVAQGVTAAANFGDDTAYNVTRALFNLVLLLVL